MFVWVKHSETYFTLKCSESIHVWKGKGMKDIIPSLSLKATDYSKWEWLRQLNKNTTTYCSLDGFLCPIYIFQKQTRNANDVQNTESKWMISHCTWFNWQFASLSFKVTCTSAFFMFEFIISSNCMGHGLRMPSLHGQKSNPKFLGTAEAHFVCHNGPNFQISLIYAFIGCP